MGFLIWQEILKNFAMITPDYTWILNDLKFVTLYTRGTAGSNFVKMVLMEIF